MGFSRKTALVACCGAFLSMPVQAASITLLAEVGPLGQALATIDSTAPSQVESSVLITGLGDGERLYSIDYRPNTGELYGLGSHGQLYTINTSTGAATAVGSGFSTALNGGSFGFDFNPVIDKIRIVGDSNQNIVADPDTGAANIASTINVFYGSGDVNEGADPNVVHHAYSGNVPNSTATQLYAIDTNLDILVTQSNNAGELGTVGALGVDVSDIGGFDIGSDGFAFLMTGPLVPDTSTLFMIDLNTGAAIELGHLGLTVSGLAVRPVPVPGAVWLFGSAVAMLGLKRKRL
ncbi:MAG: DUF4394 domain-containing protein [Pseudomonadota bacterium]